MAYDDHSREWSSGGCINDRRGGGVGSVEGWLPGTDPEGDADESCDHFAPARYENEGGNRGDSKPAFEVPHVRPPSRAIGVLCPPLEPPRASSQVALQACLA